MKLIPDAGNFWKFWSVRLGGLAALFSLLEILGELTAQLPILQPMIPDGPYALLSFFCAVAGLVARVFKQQALHPDEIP